MKRNARYAYEALKKIGAPVLDPDKGWGGHFAISAELYGRDNGFYEGHKDEAPNGNYWAYYYDHRAAGYDAEWGINKAIVDILSKYDLHAEWYNAAIIEVFDN